MSRSWISWWPQDSNCPTELSWRRKSFLWSGTEPRERASRSSGMLRASGLSWNDRKWQDGHSGMRCKSGQIVISDVIFYWMYCVSEGTLRWNREPRFQKQALESRKPLRISTAILRSETTSALSSLLFIYNLFSSIVIIKCPLLVS